MVSFLVLVIIFHRIGMIILFISSAVCPFLPIIFPDERDQPFAKRTYLYLYKVSIIGLTILGITGPIRLSYGIPKFFIFKALGIVTVFYLFLFKRNEYQNPDFVKYASYRIAAVITTATIGLLL